MNILSFKTSFALGDDIFCCPEGFSGQNCDCILIKKIIEL